MKLQLFVVGKSKFSFVREGMDHYLACVRRSVEIDVIEIKENSENKQKEAEALQWGIERRAPIKAQVILLDEKGKEFRSQDFARQVTTWSNGGTKPLVFVIGGAYGFAAEFRDRYPEKLALAKMTLPHDLVRVLFLEQMYRALHIQAGGKYHHEG